MNKDPIILRLERIQKAMKILQEEYSKLPSEHSIHDEIQARDRATMLIMDEIGVADRKAKEYVKVCDEKLKRT